MIAVASNLRGFQALPATGGEREALRKRGQFWTPLWLAEVMATWVTELTPPVLFDPAVGPGTFFAAARAVNYTGRFEGYELNESSFADRRLLDLSEDDFRGVVIGDFIQTCLNGSYKAIISNPPYIRHHRLASDQKEELRVLSRQVLGFSLDGRVGLHVYFLLKCLECLAPGGRLAFLLPADVCEGISSRALWNRVCDLFCLETVLTFDVAAAPFPKVDTNVMVFLISNNLPRKKIRWMRIYERDRDAVLRAIQDTRTHGKTCGKLISVERDLTEVLTTGLSRTLRSAASQGIPLARFAQIVRGIATGANEFFFLTSNQRMELGLDESFFVRAIGRTRDCLDEVIRPSLLEDLEMRGRPTWLLNLDHTPKERFPEELRAYLEIGETQSLHKRALIRSRRPWYKMERRTPPSILFAYLGRRDCRFILNEAGVVPLTGFLCVYPWDEHPDAIRRLWMALNHPATQENLAFVGKSYGGGALKVEPRQLDALEIPMAVVEELNLSMPEYTREGRLFERK